MIAGSGWNTAENVLCVRLDYIGDVLMTTPALRAVKETPPGRRVTLLTSPSGAAIARLVPEIDETVVYDAPWVKATAQRANSVPDLEMIQNLASRHFDAAIIFTVYSQNPLPSAMLTYLADIPLRLAHSRENPYQLLTDWLKEPEAEQMVRHEVQRQLDLVSHVGYETEDRRLSLVVPAEATGRVRRLLEQLELTGNQDWIVIHPGATAPSRRYQPEGFAEAARRLVDRGHRVVFTGSSSEAQLVDEIRGLMNRPSVSLAADLSLPEMAALLASAPLLISNNSGPVHMAAALGTPVVDLYALTNPQHTPWAVPNRVLFHDVPCKYCYKSVCPLGHHNCLRLVPPGAVVEAAEQLMLEAAGFQQARKEVV